MTRRTDDTFSPPDLAALRDTMRRQGVERIFVKRLAENDNSKQQIYLGPDLSALPMLPERPIEARTGTSRKPGASGKPIFRMPVNWFWLARNGAAVPAPHAKLIYYPQYPEVRLSGFLKGAPAGPTSLMQATRRIGGRFLLFGVGSGDRVVALVVPPNTPVARELGALQLPKFNDLFSELSARVSVTGNSRDLLIERLRQIHTKGWILAKRLERDGSLVSPYEKMNSGGYTLEAEFGVVPNGNAEPDFLGWELKQFRLPDCSSRSSVALTLMTPEPDGGYYKEEGAEAFVRRYGYRNPELPDRIDFTGRHTIGQRVARTGTVLSLEGLDPATGSLISADGGIVLSRDGESRAAARWSFAKLLEHWLHKHQQAAYVPALTRLNPKSHFYCPVVRLAQGTAFAKLLGVFAMGHAYYDPGMKLENASGRPKTKRRSQFRIGTGHLESLYDHWERVDVTR